MFLYKTIYRTIIISIYLHILNRMITIPITQIVSRNCGGCGAWIDNPLSSSSPSDYIWPGFQLGGGHGRRGHFTRSKLQTIRRKMRRTKRTRRLKIKNKTTKKQYNAKKYK